MPQLAEGFTRSLRYDGLRSSTLVVRANQHAVDDTPWPTDSPDGCCVTGRLRSKGDHRGEPEVVGISGHASLHHEVGPVSGSKRSVVVTDWNFGADDGGTPRGRGMGDQDPHSFAGSVAGARSQAQSVAQPSNGWWRPKGMPWSSVQVAMRPNPGSSGEAPSVWPPSSSTLATADSMSSTLK